MRIIKFINNLLPKRIQNNRGLLPALLPLLAKAGSAIGAAATSSAGKGLIASAGSSLLGSLFGGGSTEIEDIRSDEQKQADSFLSQLFRTGSAGGINLNEQYEGALGSYQPTQGTLGAIENLQALFGDKNIATASDAFSSLASMTAPEISDEYIRTIQRARAKAGSALDQEAAMQGSRYGTQITKSKGELDARVSDELAVRGQDLFRSLAAQKVAGAQGLVGLNQQQGELSGRIAELADIERALQDKELKDKYNAYQNFKKRQDQRIDLAKYVSENTPYLGVSSIPNASPFASLTNSILSGVGTNIGNKIGNVSSLKELFGIG